MTAGDPKANDPPRREALARHRTRCEACGEFIERGSVSVNDISWVHVECWEERESVATAVATTPAWLAPQIAPRLDPHTFSLDWLRDELEALERGVGALGWDVLDRLPPDWERLGWLVLHAELEGI
jgi:hypothetical protein